MLLRVHSLLLPLFLLTYISFLLSLFASEFSGPEVAQLLSTFLALPVLVFAQLVAPVSLLREQGVEGRGVRLRNRVLEVLGGKEFGSSFLLLSLAPLCSLCFWLQAVSLCCPSALLRCRQTFTFDGLEVEESGDTLLAEEDSLFSDSPSVSVEEVDKVESVVQHSLVLLTFSAAYAGIVAAILSSPSSSRPFAWQAPLMSLALLSRIACLFLFLNLDGLLPSSSVFWPYPACLVCGVFSIHFLVDLLYNGQDTDETGLGLRVQGVFSWLFGSSPLFCLILQRRSGLSLAPPTLPETDAEQHVFEYAKNLSSFRSLELLLYLTVSTSSQALSSQDANSSGLIDCTSLLEAGNRGGEEVTLCTLPPCRRTSWLVLAAVVYITETASSLILTRACRRCIVVGRREGADNLGQPLLDAGGR